MWFLMAPPLRPDAPQWPGRRALALLDAIGWPALWLVAMASAPFDTGVVAWTVMGVAVAVALTRAYRAVFCNERYWFSTSRWGIPIAMLIAAGFTVRLLA